jgi:hypothetical protein
MAKTGRKLGKRVMRDPAESLRLFREAFVRAHGAGRPLSQCH